MEQKLTVFAALGAVFFASVLPAAAMPQASATVTKAVDAAASDTTAHVWAVQYYYRHHHHYYRHHHYDRR